MRSIGRMNSKDWVRLAAKLSLLFTEPKVRAAVGNRIKDSVGDLTDTVAGKYSDVSETVASKYEDAADRIEAATDAWLCTCCFELAYVLLVVVRELVVSARVDAGGLLSGHDEAEQVDPEPPCFDQVGDDQRRVGRPNDVGDNKCRQYRLLGSVSTCLATLGFQPQANACSRIINLNDIAGENLKMLTRIIGKDIDLVMTQVDLWSVRADAGQIDQVIMNLAVNARDAMPSGGKLTIETANVALDEEYARFHAPLRPGDYVMFSINDTGAGINQETRSILFKPSHHQRNQRHRPRSIDGVRHHQAERRIHLGFQRDRQRDHMAEFGQRDDLEAGDPARRVVPAPGGSR